MMRIEYKVIGLVHVVSLLESSMLYSTGYCKVSKQDLASLFAKFASYLIG